MNAKAVEVVERFWELMMTNDFRSVGSLLSETLCWTGPSLTKGFGLETILPPLNEAYPAHGRWRFAVNRLVGDDHEAVSDVSMTDGVQTARAISFFTVENGMIVKMVEFWPDSYPAPENRKHLVEPIV